MDQTELITTGLEILNSVISLALVKAGQSLAEMSGREISLEGPGLKMLPIQEFTNLAGGADIPVVAIYLNVTGDFEGHLMLLFPLVQIPELVNMVLGDIDVGDMSSPLENEVCCSVLGELGNVVGTSFLNVLGNKLEMVFLPSVPYILTDYSGSILSSLALQAASLGEEYWDNALIVNTRFNEIDKKVHGFFLLLPQPGTFTEFLSKVVAIKHGSS
ncbi:MAG TPA: hypothetical protein GX522_06095 [Firmicutes bacterium]|jgi:chemotaxis protein CheC|nr:hypothetical protein [Bacillota bacterium]